MVRGGIRPQAGIRGVGGRGKIDRDGISGKRPARDRFRGKKFSDREAREPQQMPRGPRAIIFANDLDSHILSGRLQPVAKGNGNHGCTRMNTDKRLSTDGKTTLTAYLNLFPWSYLCESVCICGFKPLLFSSHKRQQRRPRSARGLQVRDCIACVKARSGAAILHAAGVPRRGNGLDAARGNRVLRSRVGGVRANAQIDEHRILDGHSHAVDGSYQGRPGNSVECDLLFYVIRI